VVIHHFSTDHVHHTYLHSLPVLHFPTAVIRTAMVEPGCVGPGYTVQSSVLVLTNCDRYSIQHPNEVNRMSTVRNDLGYDCTIQAAFIRFR